MRAWVIICGFLILCGSALPQPRPQSPPPPSQFEVGRHTFFDFGPPFDFYEIYIVRPTADGTSVERMTLTPAGNICVAPAKIEITSASLHDTVAALLGSINPCSISDKALRREIKRCKNCMVFSGANLLMQVQCGDKVRLIRSDVLDKDWFDPSAKTPEHTSWTMKLLEHLDRALGPGVLDKPMFQVPEKQEPAPMDSDSPILRDLSTGKYDALFQGAPDKPRELYRAAQAPPSPPTVRLLSIAPLPLELFVPPVYPALARMARLEGQVSFKFEVDASGASTNLIFESGQPLFQETVKSAVKSWKFPKDAADHQFQATIEFALNCPK